MGPQPQVPFLISVAGPKKVDRRSTPFWHSQVPEKSKDDFSDYAFKMFAHNSSCCFEVLRLIKRDLSRHDQLRLVESIKSRNSFFPNCCYKPLVADKLYKTIRYLNDNDRSFLAHHLERGPADPRAAREAHNAAVKELYAKSVALHSGDSLRAKIKQFATEVDRYETEVIYGWIIGMDSIVRKMEDSQKKHAQVVNMYKTVLLWEADEVMRKASIQAAQEKRAATLASKKRRKHVSVALRARLAKEYRKKLEWERSNGVALAMLTDSRPQMTSDGSTSRHVPLTVVA